MRVSKLPFKVIDVRTGREYTEDAVIKDGYTDGLMEMDLDGFMIGEDGHLAFADECGRYNYVNTIGKYEIEIEGYVSIDKALEIIDTVIEGQMKQAERYIGNGCHTLAQIHQDQAYGVQMAKQAVEALRGEQE